MILVDSNIPMFLVGADHPHKIDARRLLERLVTERQRLVTDAEVFQEILHRYTAIARRDAIQPAFDALRTVVDEVFPVEEVDVVRAKDLLGTHPALSARDALHTAVMQRRGIERVLTFDRGFDAVAGVDRIAVR
jgi:predicted nucleic acid-binding protein